MALSAKKQQEVALQVTQFNDMKPEKWMSYFKTQEEIEYAYVCGYVDATPKLGDKIRKALATRKDYLINGQGSSAEEVYPDMVVTAVPVETQRPLQNINTQMITGRARYTRPDVIITEEGKFKSLEVLKGNLHSKYPSTEESLMTATFVLVCSTLDLPSNVNYLGEPMFTNFIKIALKRLDNLEILALGGEMDEDQQNLNDFHMSETTSVDTPVKGQLDNFVKYPEGKGYIKVEEAANDSDIDKLEIHDDKEGQSEKVTEDEKKEPTHYVEDKDGQGPPNKFYSHKEARAWCKEFNAGLEKNDPKLVPRKINKGV